jgi:hypothetical protein
VIGDPGTWVVVGITIAWTLYLWWRAREKMSVTSEGGRCWGDRGEASATRKWVLDR